MKVTLKQFRDGKMEEAILAAEPPEEPKPAETKKTLQTERFSCSVQNPPRRRETARKSGKKGAKWASKRHSI